MLWAVFFSLATASAANPWADSEPDVIAELTVPVAFDVVWEQLSSVEGYAKLMPPTCGTDFTPTPPLSGVGAATHYTHIAGPWRRKLGATFTAVNRDTGSIDLDHAGKRGFVTRFTVRAIGEAQTTVTMRSYVSAPVWPLRAYYFRKVQPAWTACSKALLGGLG